MRARNENWSKVGLERKGGSRKGSWGCGSVGTLLAQHHSWVLSTAGTRCAEASPTLSTWKVEAEGPDTQCHPQLHLNKFKAVWATREPISREGKRVGEKGGKEKSYASI